MDGNQKNDMAPSIAREVARLDDAISQFTQQIEWLSNINDRASGTSPREASQQPEPAETLLGRFRVLNQIFETHLHLMAAELNTLEESAFGEVRDDYERAQAYK